MKNRSELICTNFTETSLAMFPVEIVFFGPIGLSLFIWSWKSLSFLGLLKVFHSMVAAYHLFVE